MRLIYQINEMNHDVKLVSQVMIISQPHCHVTCHVDITQP
jgi:hypothetical protein